MEMMRFDFEQAIVDGVRFCTQIQYALDDQTKFDTFKRGYICAIARMFDTHPYHVEMEWIDMEDGGVW